MKHNSNIIDELQYPLAILETLGELADATTQKSVHLNPNDLALTLASVAAMIKTTIHKAMREDELASNTD
ncbi:MAG: hypothetical protein KGV56_00130 [Gammaproteobacteria bacterium]|nr:hypothetical protein [Gammaproteobacteria bacterium]